MTRRLNAGSVLLGASLALWLLPHSLPADQIKLKDGTEVSADLLGKDARGVVVQFPRSAVASVNGQPLPPPVTEGTAAPQAEVVDLNGATQAVPDPNAKVTLLKFWATWCPHCRSDVSLMKELNAKYQGQGLRIVAASIDKDLEKLKAFVKEKELSYPVVAIQAPEASKLQASLPDLYETQGVPGYFLIDSHGMIAKTFAGSLTESKVDLESILKPLLGIAQTPPSADGSAVTAAVHKSVATAH